MASQKKPDRIRDFKSLTEYEALKAKEGDVHIVEYEATPIRSILNGGEWCFSVVDVIAALTDSTNARRYWSDLKTKLADEEGFVEVYEKIVQLELPAPDGKLRDTNCAAPDILFRIIQSIPSPKAEPFKRWFAEVAYEWLKDKAEPSRAIDRAIAEYRRKGIATRGLTFAFKTSPDATASPTNGTSVASRSRSSER